MQTFRNPISPFDAPDPFMTYDPVTGYYYALFSRHSKLELFRSHMRARSSQTVTHALFILQTVSATVFGVTSGLRKCTAARTVVGIYTPAEE